MYRHFLFLNCVLDEVETPQTEKFEQYHNQPVHFHIAFQIFSEKHWFLLT